MRNIDPIESILEDASKGKMYILIDDSWRENEGDVVISATCVDDDAINFMITHARGLVCLALSKTRAQKLELDLQPRRNMGDTFKTAFTTSIDARSGITTGISAADRAHTISVAIADDTGPQDVITPGHIFPLIASDRGVLQRRGHTEASTDIAKIIGQPSAAVICEVINKDGTMARLPQLLQFAEAFSLKVGAIRDLVNYRKKHNT